MCNIGVIAQDRLMLSVISEKPFQGEAGYYFGLESIPLSQNQYIFVATPLKKAYLIIDDQKIIVGHTMTVKDRKGFTEYFSGEKYNAKLMIKEESKTIAGITDYRGILEIQQGAKNRRFKIHGSFHQ
ncbi:MAG: hypothetical protein ABIN80_04625 [Dyadobacter sp.]|uniref:hypothetical protein n=2 Tax=Dyadobacter sp. TaxID=1914288 RepID=UPI003262FC83